VTIFKGTGFEPVMMQFLTKDLTAAFIPQQGAPAWITAKLRRAFSSEMADCFGRFLSKLK
jgi:hypothetical protein